MGPDRRARPATRDVGGCTPLLFGDTAMQGMAGAGYGHPFVGGAWTLKACI
jgi:hypothetical protein